MCLVLPWPVFNLILSNELLSFVYLVRNNINQVVEEAHLKLPTISPAKRMVGSLRRNDMAIYSWWSGHVNSLDEWLTKRIYNANVEIYKLRLTDLNQIDRVLSQGCVKQTLYAGVYL